MKHLKRVVPIILLAIFALIPTTSHSQNTSEYTLTSDGVTMTFTPRPDLGYVIQTDKNNSSTQEFEGMLSSTRTIQSKKIKGLNKRNLTIVKNLDSSANNAYTILQSQNQSGYTAPLYSVNNQTIAIIPEIVVKLVSENAYEFLQSICENLNLTIKQKLELSNNEYLLGVNGINEQSVFDCIEKLEDERFIEWAFPNIATQPILSQYTSSESEEENIISDDEYFANLWHLYNTGQTNGTPGADVNATKAWKITTGDPNIVIAIIDTGVDINHPDLVNNIVPGYDFVDDDNDASPSLFNIYDAHGTMCAGLAAAQGNNQIGVSGVAWNCKIMPVKIADDDIFLSDSDIATALRWAAENGADVLSNSWGAYYSSPVLKSALRDVTAPGGIGRDGKGCVVCFAAGNWDESGGPVMYPAAYSYAIAVGATDHDDQAWDYSASGPELDIAAPSGPGTYLDYIVTKKPYLWTTDITGIYGYSSENNDPTIFDYSDSMSGTSGACPLVAGTAALVLSIDPNLTSTQVRAILLESAVDLGEPGKDNYYGYGRVDANAAVVMAFDPPEISANITIFVDDNAPNDPCAFNPYFSDPNENGTPEHPFDSIQEAIDFAISNEIIMVRPGTYSGMGNYNIDTLGKPLTIISESGPENCIIDCQEFGRAFYMHSEESPETEISGFTITNGNALNGGGIYCSDFSNPTITNCIISNCTASSLGYLGGLGGGMYIDYSDPGIYNCTFSNNKASLSGGAISISEGDPIIISCTFNDNTSEDTGGAIYNYYYSPMFEDCNFCDNSAATNGGAIYNEEGYTFISNCVLTNNQATTSSGGAICNYYGDSYINNSEFNNNSAGDSGGAIFNVYGYYYGSTIYNCLFHNNTANNDGGAMSFYEENYIFIENCTFTKNNAQIGNAISCDSSSWWSYGSLVEMSNCIIWNGTNSIANIDSSYLDIFYSDVEMPGNNKWQGIGNINKDPYFADPNINDYHLKSEAGRWEPNSGTWILDDVTSPCIDTGDPSYEIYNEPIPNGTRINMGFYGGTSEASKSSPGSVDPNDPNTSSTKAYYPSPEDLSYSQEYTPTLSWFAGVNAVRHDIYLGTDLNAVSNATRENPMAVLKNYNQISTSYTTEPLHNFITYYWRVDEVLADNTIIKGDIWTFTVYVQW